MYSRYKDLNMTPGSKLPKRLKLVVGGALFHPEEKPLRAVDQTQEEKQTYREVR